MLGQLPVPLSTPSAFCLYAACRDFGSIGEEELLSASLALASIDHVLLMEKAGLNDLVMRAGLGWNHSLGAVHWRW